MAMGCLEMKAGGVIAGSGGDWGTASPACAARMHGVKKNMEIAGIHIPRGGWICTDKDYVCSIQPD